MSEHRTSQNPAQRIAHLADSIRHHDRLYYVLGTPKISDQEYDTLFRELVDLQDMHPELADPESPTERVGSDLVEGFPKVEHRVPMLSIDNTYSCEEVREYEERIRRSLGGHDATIDYHLDLKIDGIALTLWYENGRLTRGVTRGDGTTGDDVTSNIRTIRNIPLLLGGGGDKHSLPPFLEIRGEVFLPRSQFDRINEERHKSGSEPFANPRNACAGTLKLLDPHLVSKRQLRFVAHSSGEIPAESGASSFHELLLFFEALGFSTGEGRQVCSGIDAAIGVILDYQESTPPLDHDIDGVVLSVDSLALRERLGTRSRSPRWLVAYKFPSERARTRLLDVSFQVGKTGTITPVAHFEPVQLVGTTVENATLHNFDRIETLDVRIGDLLVIQKAGEIIPQVVEVVRDSRTGEERPIDPPSDCPVCHGPVGRQVEGVALRCLSSDCPAQLHSLIRAFAARGAMDIRGLGTKLVETLVREGRIQNPADLFGLTEADLTSLERMGEKSANNLLDAIESSKTRGLERLLVALGIRHVGERAAQILAQHFGSLDLLSNQDAESLSTVHEIGPKIAESLLEWFEVPEHRQMMNTLRKAGVSLDSKVGPPGESAPEIASGGIEAFQEKTVVVTGSFRSLTRNGICALIREAGGRTTSSVSKKTDWLVVGQNPGSKLARARELGVSVLEEEDFLKQIGQMP